MSDLDQSYEKNLLLNGHLKIVGIDEAGRGAWAGPVVAACIVFDKSEIIGDIIVRDSKLVSPVKRKKSYDYLIKNYDYGIGVVDNVKIDEIGILQATKLAMLSAIEKLKDQPDYLLIDAVKLDLAIKQENIIKGDNKVWSIAAASILAKVYRDQLMVDLHHKYSQYGFDLHKGYGTKLHQDNLDQFGVSSIHRSSYQPIKIRLK